MALIICPECGGTVSDKAETCPHCGYILKKEQQTITNEKICPECGKVNTMESEFCINCGCPLSNRKNKIFAGLDMLTGAKNYRSVSIKDLFSTTFQKRTKAERDAVFESGTALTTPPLSSVGSDSPKPWLYFKVFMLLGISFIIMTLGLVYFQNTNFLPGMVILGSFAVPFSILILFYEINLYNNISFYQVLKMFILGGVLSLITAIVYFSIIPVGDLNVEGAIMVGIIEEFAKIVIVIIFLAQNKDYKYILNGLLVGAAVGAGFAAFESAGYALRIGLSSSVDEMVANIFLRGFLAPGGHIIWAAIEGAALMFVKGLAPLNKKHFNSPKFWAICLIPIALHALWDMPFMGHLPLCLDYILLIVAGWVVVFYFVGLGLQQIEEAKLLERRLAYEAENLTYANNANQNPVKTFEKQDNVGNNTL